MCYFTQSSVSCRGLSGSFGVSFGFALRNLELSGFYLEAKAARVARDVTPVRRLVRLGGAFKASEKY